MSKARYVYVTWKFNKSCTKIIVKVFKNKEKAKELSHTVHTCKIL